MRQCTTMQLNNPFVCVAQWPIQCNSSSAKPTSVCTCIPKCGGRRLKTAQTFRLYEALKQCMMTDKCKQCLNQTTPPSLCVTWRVWFLDGRTHLCVCSTLCTCIPKETENSPVCMCIPKRGVHPKRMQTMADTNVVVNWLIGNRSRVSTWLRWYYTKQCKVKKLSEQSIHL